MADNTAVDGASTAPGGTPAPNPAATPGFINLKVFVEIMPHVIIDYEVPQDALKLTDRTLMAILEMAKHPIDIIETVTSFTVKGLVKVLEMHRKSGDKIITWNLGVMLPTELSAADNYFNKNTGFLKNEYEIHVGDNEEETYYHLVRVHSEDNKSVINFSVRKNPLFRF